MRTYELHVNGKLMWETPKLCLAYQATKKWAGRQKDVRLYEVTHKELTLDD